MKNMTLSIMYRHQIQSLTFHARLNLVRIGNFNTNGFSSLLGSVTQKALMMPFVFHVSCLVAKLGEMPPN